METKQIIFLIFKKFLFFTFLKQCNRKILSTCPLKLSLSGVKLSLTGVKAQKTNKIPQQTNKQQQQKTLWKSPQQTKQKTAKNPPTQPDP